MQAYLCDMHYKSALPKPEDLPDSMRETLYEAISLNCGYTSKVMVRALSASCFVFKQQFEKPLLVCVQALILIF